ncbi:hypothetical protein SAV14893_085600 [Streptomyces avermitilis]|uniref:Uncharacterized protein n=1 Tax=Streptomyces avermitilis TaxID=33903 RepID=A0A4D4N7D9_STRAX|nr:hypothetical protein SAV14893_085600 [Streptomyces avermitilis]GDY79415.1 hypothetical protein SAV31267_089000 [Streptomyces avermitilis]GDY88344.1 hypothetical protein SAVCW2_75430 [Streptomyces avermitilis]
MLRGSPILPTGLCARGFTPSPTPGRPDGSWRVPRSLFEGVRAPPDHPFGAYQDSVTLPCREVGQAPHGRVSDLRAEVEDCVVTGPNADVGAVGTGRGVEEEQVEWLGAETRTVVSVSPHSSLERKGGGVRPKSPSTS